MPVAQPKSKPKTSKLPILSRLNVCALIVWWILINGVAERTAFTTFGLYLPQHPFLLPTLILLMWSAWKKNRRACWFNGATLLIFGVILLGVHLPLTRLLPAPASSHGVRVMTWNVLSSSAGTQKIAGEIKAQKPDIVCLQETLGRRGVVPDRTPELIGRFPGWHAQRANEVTLISRWPIANVRLYKNLETSTRRVLAVTCQTPNGPLDVIVAHISTSAPGSRYGGGKPRSLNRLIETARLVHGTAQTRLKQLPTLDTALDEAQRSGRPYVLAGDFNNPPRGGFYRHLKTRLIDSFARGGLGSGFTFPAKLPVMRIDYIWLGRGVSARRTYVMPTNASDHRALVSDVAVRWK